MHRGLFLTAGLLSAIATACPRPALADDAAQPPPPAASASAPPASASTTAAPASPPPAPTPVVTAAPALSPAKAQGAIVIAVGDDAAPSARALAREVYGSEALRPAIDDATARVLAGEAPPPGGPAKLTEIADVRKAAQAAASDAVTRRLYASLGADLGAALVVPVTLRDGKPVARVLHVAKAAFEPLELTGTIQPSADGTSRVQWTGVTALLTAVAPPRSPASTPTAAPPRKASPAPGPLAPKKEGEEHSRSIFSSPWTWVGIGVVATAGVIVLVASQTQGDAGTLKLQGRVAP